MHTARTSVAALAALLLAAAPAAAQTGDAGAAVASSTKGFFLGAHLNGTAIGADDLSDESETGGGLGVQLGYGFTRSLALVLDGTGSLMGSGDEEFTLGHFDVAIRYAFTSPTRRVVPFLEVGYAGFAAQQDDAEIEGSTETGDLSLVGTGVMVGGGLQYYVSPKLALGLGLKWTTGEFTEAEIGGVRLEDLGIDATTTRVNLGLTWYPGGGR